MARLTTERLKARPVALEDLPFVLALFSDPEVAKTMGGTRSRSQVEESLMGNISEWKNRGYGVFLFFTQDNKFVGRAGLRALEIEGEAVVELMYALMPSFWNQGYGFEVAKACVEYAFTQTDLDELVCYTLHMNKGSQRIMEKLGFTYEKEITHAGLPHVLYRLKKTDYTY
jgi:RimJ/RimL family protein N-acetyltransferase